MSKYIFLCMVFTLLGAFGGYFFKKAASESRGIVRIALSPYLYAGGLCYVSGALLNILLLRELRYTVVLPLTSITYVWTLVISRILLKEKVTYRKLSGVAFIILGAVLLAAV